MRQVPSMANIYLGPILNLTRRHVAAIRGHGALPPDWHLKLANALSSSRRHASMTRYTLGKEPVITVTSGCPPELNLKTPRSYHHK